MIRDAPGLDEDDHAILPWRIVAGAFLHFAVPAYIIAVPLACFFTAPQDAVIEDLIRLALPVSGWFLALYTGAGLLFSLGAAALDPLLRRRRARRDARMIRDSPRRDPERDSPGRSLTGAACSVLGRCRRWKAFGVPLGSWRSTRPGSDGRPCGDHADLNLGARHRARRAPRRHPGGRGRRARSDRSGGGGAVARNAAASTKATPSLVARYVESRYGTSDFTGDQP